ncbi:hypothetical protein [Vibrio sp. R78045]|uniref:hypothetical protein n=1 Tax=Vibrio sp. R78045 TaxID=3093868 RepID=UPI0036F4325B
MDLIHEIWGFVLTYPVTVFLLIPVIYVFSFAVYPDEEVPEPSNMDIDRVGISYANRNNEEQADRRKSFRRFGILFVLLSFILILYTA